jgi:hypothetical protein
MLKRHPCPVEIRMKKGTTFFGKANIDRVMNAKIPET